MQGKNRQRKDAKTRRELDNLVKNLAATAPKFQGRAAPPAHRFARRLIERPQSAANRPRRRHTPLCSIFTLMGAFG
jgi:hypothetical protein